MRLFRLLALLGMVAGGAGCGLPDAYFLQPPAVNIQATPSDPTFRIVGTDRGSDTGADFQGYELYYKFYGGTGDATFNSDATSFGTGSTNTDLIQAGFHRLCLGPNNAGLTADTSAVFASAPLINIKEIDLPNIELSYSVRIRLNDPGKPESPAPNSPSLSYYVYAKPAPSTAVVYAEVRRFVTAQSGNECKSFAPNSVSGVVNWDAPAFADIDLSGTTGNAIWTQVVNNNSGNIYVMVYALSYGLSTASVGGVAVNTPVYSSPVYLGYVTALVYP